MEHKISASFTARISNFTNNLKIASNTMKMTAVNIKNRANELKSLSFSDLSPNLRKEFMRISKDSEIPLREVVTNYRKMQSDLKSFSSGASLNDFQNEISEGDIYIKQLARAIKQAESEKKKLASARFVNNSKEIENVNNRIKKLKDKLIRAKIASAEFRNEINKIKSPPSDSKEKGLGFKKGVKNLIKYSLALIGIRSAFMFLKGIGSDMIQKNERLRTRFEAIKDSIGQALLPVINQLINAFSRLVPYIIMAINYLFTFINIIFKTNLGITKSVKPLENQRKGMKKNTKAVRDLKKELGGLASFDSIIQIDTEKKDSGGSTDHVDTAFYDEVNSKLTKLMPNLEKFRNFIEKHKTLIKGLGLLLLGLKLAAPFIKAIKWISALNPKVITLIKYIGGLASIVGGVFFIFTGLSDILNGNLNTGILKIIAGCALLAIGLALVGGASLIIPVLIGVAIATALVIIWKFRDKIIEFLENLTKKLEESTSLMPQLIGVALRTITDMVKNTFKGIEQFLRGFKEFFQGIFSLDSKKIWSGLKGILRGMGNILIGFIEGVMNSFLFPLNSIIKTINKIPGVNLPALNIKIPKIPKLANGGVASSSTIAEIGEGRYKEAVIPLESSPQFRNMKKDIANAVVEGLSNSKTSGGVAKVEIDILAGGIKLGKKLIDLIEETEEVYSL